MDLEHYLMRLGVCGLSRVLDDMRLVELARKFAMSRRGHAEQHLDHYLRGQGRTKEVSIELLLEEDQGVRQAVVMGVIMGLASKLNGGVIALPQNYFRNEDWQFATGGINMAWQLIMDFKDRAEALVELSFTNRYRWHPDEDRWSQPVHQAAEHLKQRGASDYMMAGRPYILAVPYLGT